MVLQHLPEDLIGNRTGRRITVILPPWLVQGYERQHINGRFEQEHRVIRSGPVKAVLRLTSWCITFEAPFGSGTSLVNVTDIPCRIPAEEHRIVILRGLTNQLPVHKGIQNILVDPPLTQQVSIDPAHILGLFRQFQSLTRKGLHRYRNLWNPHGDQGFHRIGIFHAVEVAEEFHRVTAQLFVLIEPEIPPKSDLSPCVKPLILRA